MTFSMFRDSSLASLAFVLLMGCGAGSVGTNRAKEISHVGAITTLYFRADSVLRKSPASEQEFKEVIAQQNVDPGVLGVGSTDELFISDRDGQPLVVNYGQTSPLDIVAYEQVGKDGVRLVGFKNGQIEAADATRFAKLVPTPASAQ
jgi:hypothetical protein